MFLISNADCLIVFNPSVNDCEMCQYASDCEHWNRILNHTTEIEQLAVRINLDTDIEVSV